MDRIDEAEKFLQILNFYVNDNSKSINKETAITALGTNALYLIKINEVDEGIKLYNEAINMAKKSNINYYVLAGKLNMAKELKQLKHPDSEEKEKEVLSLKLENYKDLEEFRRRNFPFILEQSPHTN
ncbi:hypothetical protein HX13_17940 [Chryseobacterium sp. P1-3]|uniref:hypothetical protein n=1 Tax=Chryseobacterium sp. (strain P1-3) TaxID=1517683 RepID=UPI0004E6D0AA|nr:hypothetical protein [Chryseobacterium sp. P1-3]KFF73701.1 hypothetical protein HX13_17940 [Chryseobacterium sp. P1-3]